MFDQSNFNRPNTTRNLTVLYVAALGAIGLLLLVGYVFVDRALIRQTTDSYLINIAGRQRMLSQKLSKEALAVAIEKDVSARCRIADDLQATIALWETSHRGLQTDEFGSLTNSAAVAEMFARIEPHHLAMLAAAREIVGETASGGGGGEARVLSFVKQIQARDEQFLEGMNEIVFQLDREAAERVVALKRHEMYLLFAVLIVLLLEGLLIFRPAVGKIRRTIAEIEVGGDRLQREKAVVKLLQSIAVAANESANFEEAITVCLRQVCDFTGWSIGHAYLLAEGDEPEMVSTNLWHITEPERFETFRQVTEGTRFMPRVGLPGDVLATGKPKWIADVTERGVNFQRARQARDIGVKAGFAFPVLVGAESVAVLEFFSPETAAPDEEILQIMAHAGTQLGRAVERQRAKDALQKEREFLSAVFDNVADGIVACDAGGALTFFNRATREFHGLPSERVPNDQWAEHFDLYLPDGKTRMRKDEVPLFRALRDGSVREVELIIAPKDLPVRRLIVSGRAFFDQHGTKRGAVVGMHDITEQYRVEQSLRETTTLQRAILDGANYMIIATGLDGTITAFNSAAERLTGYAAIDVVGKSTPAVIHDAEEIAEHGRELAAEFGVVPEAGKEFEFFVTKARMGIASEREWTIVRRDETRFSALMSISATRDADGAVVGYLAIGSDLTERKKAEQSLRATEERFKTFMDNNPAVAYIKDDAGRFVYVNHSFERVFQMEKQTLIGKTDFDFWSEDVAMQVRENDAAVLKSGEPSEILETVPTPDGLSQSWLSHKFPVADVSGRTFIGGVSINVTERERANEARQASERRYRHLVEFSQGLICTQDMAGNLLSVNPAAARLLEYEPEEMIGRNIKEFLAPAQQPFFDLYLERASRNETASGLFTIVTKSGVERVFQYHNLRYEEAGQPPYVIGYAQDVTELKLAEETVRKLSITDELTGLHNRRGFLTLTEQQRKNSRRAGLPFSLIYADMDGLKQINDTYGHQAGSDALCRIADILRKSFRDSDIIARLGGDEFTIFLSDTAADNVAAPLARLRENLRQHNARKTHDYELSISVGTICIEPDDESSIEELLTKADNIMYENKKLKRQTKAPELVSG